LKSLEKEVILSWKSLENHSQISVRTVIRDHVVHLMNVDQPTLRPSQLTGARSPPAGCYHPHPPSPFISRRK